MNRATCYGQVTTLQVGIDRNLHTAYVPTEKLSKVAKHWKKASLFEIMTLNSKSNYYLKSIQTNFDIIDLLLTNYQQFPGAVVNKGNYCLRVQTRMDFS